MTTNTQTVVHVDRCNANLYLVSSHELSYSRLQGRERGWGTFQSFSKLSFYLNTISDMMELLKMVVCVSFGAGFAGQEREKLWQEFAADPKIAVMGSQIGQGKLSIRMLQHFSC